MDFRLNNTLYAESSNASGNGCTISISNGIQINQWQQITFSVNGSNATIYVNGKSAGTGTSCNGLPFYPESILVGTINTSGSSQFNGLIDDVQIFTQALTLEQVQRLYAEGRGTHPLARE